MGATTVAGNPGSASVAQPASAIPRVTATALDRSPNWAGYVARDRKGMTKSFTSVTATWKQPKASCASGAAASAFWVGLGGYGPSATGLLQIGTDTDCTDTNEQKYYAWYDIPPNQGACV